MASLVQRRLWRTLVPIILSACLTLLMLFAPGSLASAQERTAEESLVEALVFDVNAFWDREFAARGFSYSPAELAFLYDEPVNSGCGPVFPAEGPLYCALDQTFYYPVDWRYEGRDLASYGESVMGWAISHEIGHHAQQQMDVFGIQGWFSIPLEQAELQSDCFAGAWAKQANQQLGTGDIEAVLAALENAGGPWHGTATDRIAWFELGYDTGDPAQCFTPSETTPV
jgi:predicted metalloprotease